MRHQSVKFRLRHSRCIILRMSNKCRRAGKHILLVCSFLVAMVGAVQLFAALALNNSAFMLFFLATGLWAVTTGVSAVVLETCMLGKSESSTRRSFHKRLLCIRFSLITTVIIVAVALFLLLLHRAEVVGPWPEVIPSNRTLAHEPVRKAFYSTSFWVVIGASVAEIVISLCAFVSTFYGRGSSNCSRHRNLCFVESSGWVYESSPRPGSSADSPSRRLIDEQSSTSHHRPDRHNIRSGSSTLQSFKHDTINRHGTLSKQTSKEKLVLVDSNAAVPPAPLNITFTSNGYVLGRHNTERNVSSRSHLNSHGQYIPLKDLAEVSECSSPEISPK